MVAAVGACLLAPSASLYALGMGDIDVHSGLNQPLDASIRLISVDEGELDGLEVRLAPKAAFERMGLDRMKILSNLEFEVVSEGRSAPYVKVSSRAPVREPFLNFILSVNWANGQMLREYTLLLDPPVFDKGEAASPIEEAVTSPATIAREAMNEFESTARHEVTFAAPGSGSYGPTKTTDTLWAIARDMRPDSSVSVPQMMLALLKENPEAFINGNVNNLKAGYVLRAPQMSTIAALSRGQAASETNRQYQAWLASKGKTGARPAGQRQLATESAPVAEQLAQSQGGAGGVSPSASGGAAQARLQLVSPDDAASSGGSGGADEGKVATLQQQLAVALESAEASRQENADLRSRLNELEKQLANVQRLITLQDDTMSALQGGLAAQPAEVSAPADVIEKNEVDLSVIDESSSLEPVSGDMVAAGAEQESSSVAEKTTPAVRTPPPQPSFIDSLLENPTMLAVAGGGAALALVLLGLMMRRRRQSVDDDLFDSSAPVGGAGASTAAVASSVAVASSAATASDQPIISDDLTKEESGLGEAVGDIDEYGGFGDELGTIHADESEIDPIAEADVYLAYRRYEQAESLLKEAIQQDDTRPELKLKLMEIYYTTKDQEAFEAQAEAFYAASGGADEALWGQAVEMGKELCPDHPLFSESGGVLDDSVDQSDGDILDLGDDDVAATSQDEHLDFESLSEPEPEPLRSGEQDEFSKDGSEFDLDLSEPLSDDVLTTESSDLGLDLDSSLLEEFETDKGLREPSAEKITDDLDLNLDQPLSEEAELDIKLGLDDSSLADGAVFDEMDSSLDSGSDLLGSETGRSEGSDSADVIDEFADLDLNLSDFESKEAEIELSSGQADEASDVLVETDFELGLGVEEEAGSPVIDNLNLDEITESGDFIALDDEPIGTGDVLTDDFIEESANLDNVINFENPETALNESEVPGETLSGLDGELEGLATSLGDEANSMSLDLVDSTESSEVEVADEASAEPTNWEIEPAISSFGEMDEEYSLFESTDDVVGTKLDLAKAYIDMGDQDGARSILDEVVKEGSDTQREEAEQLMQQIG